MAIRSFSEGMLVETVHAGVLCGSWGKEVEVMRVCPWTAGLLGL